MNFDPVQDEYRSFEQNLLHVSSLMNHLISENVNNSFDGLRKE